MHLGTVRPGLQQRTEFPGELQDHEWGLVEGACSIKDLMSDLASALGPLEFSSGNRFRGAMALNQGIRTLNLGFVVPLQVCGAWGHGGNDQVSIGPPIPITP